MTRLPLLLLSLLSLCSRAEDLNGIWKGTLTQGPGGCYPSYFLELQISIAGDAQHLIVVFIIHRLKVKKKPAQKLAKILCQR